MLAAVHDRYGPPDVVRVINVPEPVMKEDEILVRVFSTTVTTADWRLRSSTFPRFAWLPGRLVLGLFRPRHRILGSEFSGMVAATGALVTRFTVGDPVVGFKALGGAHAEYVNIRQDGPVCRKPAELSDNAAVCLPFGGLTALVFLRDFAKLMPGQRLLVVGASGGVGVYAVQLGKHYGAEVTGVCSGANAPTVLALGADRVIDHQRGPIREDGAVYDVVLDTVGKLTFAEARRMLTPSGVFIPLEFDFREIFQYLGNVFRNGPRILIGMSGDQKEDLEQLAALAASGSIKPVIDQVFPLEQIVEAHRRTESRHKRGSVVVSVSSPDDTTRLLEVQ